jgi:hypothetical protein
MLGKRGVGKRGVGQVSLGAVEAWGRKTLMPSRTERRRDQMALEHKLAVPPMRWMQSRFDSSSLQRVAMQPQARPPINRYRA